MILERDLTVSDGTSDGVADPALDLSGCSEGGADPDLGGSDCCRDRERSRGGSPFSTESGESGTIFEAALRMTGGLLIGADSRAERRGSFATRSSSSSSSSAAGVRSRFLLLLMKESAWDGFIEVGRSTKNAGDASINALLQWGDRAGRVLRYLS